LLARLLIGKYSNFAYICYSHLTIIYIIHIIRFNVSISLIRQCRTKFTIEVAVILLYNKMTIS